MSKAAKISLIGGIFLLVMMLIQIKYDYDIAANFDEFQSKRIEIVKNQLNSSGLSEYQSHLIASAIGDETWHLKSTVFTKSLMQSYFMTMSGIIIISLVGYAIRKDKNKKTD